jgi:2-keto-3-deoxy-L-fuconate dehydrogenase
MTDRLLGRKALVTAAAAGIGRATALAFAREGAIVVATDIDAARLGEICGDRIATRRLDVRDDGAVAAVVAEAGPVDILMNCAGHVHSGTILDAAEADWDLSFDINIKAMWRTVRAVLPGMLTAGGGSIINVASVASSVRGVANRCVYGATKGAVIGLTKGIAADFVGRGIRCNAICPGTIDTPSLRGRIAGAEAPEAARRDFLARQPMGRFGTAEEIAALALYLASSESSFTTGTIQIIDGGWMM